MRFRSKKRQAQQEEYNAAKQVVTERDKTCVCDRWSKVKCYYPEGKPDHDHIISLGRGGSYTDPLNMQLLCRVDHDLKDNFPTFANTLGLNGPLRVELEKFKFKQTNPDGDWDEFVETIRQCWDIEKRRFQGLDW